MKAILCRQYGPPDVLKLEPVPPPGPPGAGEVLVKIRASGVNFADRLMIAGHYQDPPPLPFIPGFEAAGEIVAAGAGVSQFKPGDRVVTLNRYGGYAEAQLCPQDGLVRLPDGISFETAAAMAVAYGTADIALRGRANLQPGETLLVTGAGGGAGLAAVELGKLMGARVIALAGSDDRLNAAKAQGADHVIDHRTGDIAAQIAGLTQGRGIDAAYDTVGATAFQAALKSIAFEGRIVVIGFASGDIPRIPAGHLLVKNASVTGVFWGAYKHKKRDALKQSLAHVLALAASGALTPRTGGVYPLAQAAEAISALIRRQAVAKLILTIG